MKNNALIALTAAASALPACQAQADEVADEFQIGYRYYAYDEEAFQTGDTFLPVIDRYDIDVNQFNLIAPLNESTELNANYQQEKMSGASPWYTVLDENGDPVQIMSGASIEDERRDAAVSVKTLLGNDSVVVTLATSDEDDYESRSAAVQYNMESQDRLSIYTFAADLSLDDINAVDADLFLTRPATEQGKRSSSLLFSYSRILNKTTVAKFSAGYSRKTGYLSDPYKLVLIGFDLLGDSRPEARHSRTLAAQVRWFSDDFNGALHADYRFYDDSWDIRSHTFELAWYQNLGWGVQLVPSVRLYNQQEAYFYQVFYQEARPDGFHSTDYRLSEFGAITYGLKLNKAFESWSFTLSAEKYESGGDTGLANADVENPGLLDFELLAIGVNYRF